MNELSSYDILLYPLKELADVQGIQIIPYFTGVFEQFEYSLIANETWDLDSILKVTKEYSNGTPLLELGCGSGRVALHLVNNGFEVHGIDSSNDSLNRFREKLKNIPSVSDKVNILHGDILTYNFIDKYDLVILPNLSIHLFNTENLLVSLFEVVKSISNYKAIFCFSIFEKSHIERMSMYNGNTFCTPFVDNSGEKNIMWRTLKFDKNSNTLALSCYLQNRNSDNNNIGYLSAHLNKFWTLEEIMNIIGDTNWRIVRIIDDSVENGGADGFKVQTVVIQNY